MALNISDFQELVRSRKSCRKFKPDPIPDECIEEILEATRWAMSGANGQPWEFIVVKDQQTKDKLAEAMNEQNDLTVWMETSRVKEMRQPFYRKIPQVIPQPEFQVAPVVIVVCADPRTAQATVLARLSDYRWVIPENISMATQILHLAVAACGLRSQFVTIHALAEQLIKPVLGIPPIYKIFSLAPIGYPAFEPGRSYRRELREFVHYDKYDMSKYRSHQEVQEFIRQLRERSKPVYPLSAKEV